MPELIDARCFQELLDERVAATPDELMMLDDRGRSVSFAEYREQVDVLAAGLMPLGVGRDVHVSWIMPTVIEATVMIGALARLEAIQNPIIPIYREREVGFIARQSKARLLAVPGTYRGFDFLAMAREIATQVDGLTVLDVSRELPTGDPASLPPKPRPTDPDDAPIRFLMYTSGTTSDPKGALHTDWNMIVHSRGLANQLDLGPTDRVGMVFPITHVGGFSWLCCSLLSGAKLLMVETFDPKSTVDFLSANGVTHAGAGTAFHLTYLEAQRARGGPSIFPAVRCFPGGGAPKPPQLHYDLKNEIGGVGIPSGYGMTECPIISNASVFDPDEKLAYTEGRPNPPETRVRVVSLDERDCAAGEEGEIRVLAPQCCKGYLDPALNADAFDAQGCFRTGDLGYQDADGYIVITGRLKDVIIRNGENISAKEIEDMLYQHPKVADVAVVGLPDSQTGERACAVVACKDASDPLGFEEMIADLKSAKLMAQKLPEQLEIVDEIPRNPSGKILKKDLRARFESAPFSRSH
jgi:acyl-CoA synthetase (AMP-forming)/AMP-acid ligase II